MEPFTAIALAGKIASATGLTGWISEKLGKKLGDKTAEKIGSIAQIATGMASPEDALKAIEADKEAANKVRMMIMEHEHELKLALLEDVQSARSMYTQKNAMADKIAERVIKENHLLVILLVLANVLILSYVENAHIAAVMGNVIGYSISSLWQERQQVIGFFFGSSLGSKIKDALKTNA